MAFWRKRKASSTSDYSALFARSPSDYTQFIADFVEEMDPATRAHVAVAYQNLLPWVGALYQYEKERGNSFTIESAIEILSHETELREDEINKRRFAWLGFAALIARLEKLARDDPSIIPMSATIWTIIATEYPRLKILLPNNVVWKSEEKVWFDLNESDADLIRQCVNHHIPPQFSSNEIVERFADSLGIFYWPSTSRIGFIP